MCFSFVSASDMEYKKDNVILPIQLTLLDDEWYKLCVVCAVGHSQA